MRLSVSVSEVNPKQTMVRSGDHHQIWFGTPDIFLMFDSDSAMLAFATDLYSKTVAAVSDEVIAQTDPPEQALKEYEFDAGLGNPTD